MNQFPTDQQREPVQWDDMHKLDQVEVQLRRELLMCRDAVVEVVMKEASERRESLSQIEKAVKTHMNEEAAVRRALAVHLESRISELVFSIESLAERVQKDQESRQPLEVGTLWDVVGEERFAHMQEAIHSAELSRRDFQSRVEVLEKRQEDSLSQATQGMLELCRCRMQEERAALDSRLQQHQESLERSVAGICDEVRLMVEENRKQDSSGRRTHKEKSRSPGRRTAQPRQDPAESQWPACAALAALERKAALVEGKGTEKSVSFKRGLISDSMEIPR